MHRYPFGRPLRAVHPSASGPRRVFVLGNYPSALHVHWTPPPSLGLGAVQALAVADEPEPFWNGSDETEAVDAWAASVGARAEWGTFAPAGRFNGSTGRHLDQQYLAPLGAPANDVWITDVVNTYFVSEAGAAAIASRYAPAAAALGLPAASLPPRPATDELIRLATEQHTDRLNGEFDQARPEHVLTIGNESLAVLWQIGVAPTQAVTRLAQLSAATYGRRIPIRPPGGHGCLLHPLAHPNLLFNPKPGANSGQRAGVQAFKRAHARWTHDVLRDLRR